MTNEQFEQLSEQIAVLEGVVIAVIGAIGEAGVDRDAVSQRVRTTARKPENAEMRQRLELFAERIDRIPRTPPRPSGLERR